MKRFIKAYVDAMMIVLAALSLLLVISVAAIVYLYLLEHYMTITLCIQFLLTPLLMVSKE